MDATIFTAATRGTSVQLLHSIAALAVATIHQACQHPTFFMCFRAFLLTMSQKAPWNGWGGVHRWAGLRGAQSDWALDHFVGKNLSSCSPSGQLKAGRQNLNLKAWGLKNQRKKRSLGRLGVLFCGGTKPL